MSVKIWLYDASDQRRLDTLELQPLESYPLEIVRDGKRYRKSDYAFRGRGGRCGEVMIYDSRLTSPAPERDTGDTR